MGVLMAKESKTLLLNTNPGAIGNLFEFSNSLKVKTEVMYFVLMKMWVGKIYFIPVRNITVSQI
ncbi:hypothetical protein C5167_041645 [Papaver somniferum]|nr:hypothetical protein C5167_041645 [Papaver somniferum]